MLLEEIIRSCRSESVAQAAVASIGPHFAHDIECAAQHYGMTIGGFTSHLVGSFADRGDEGEMRAVRAAMDESHAPILAGLERILSLRLITDTSRPQHSTRVPAQFA